MSSDYTDLIRLLATLYRLRQKINEVRDSIRREILRAIGLDPGDLGLRLLYDLTPPPQPSLDELVRRIAESIDANTTREEDLVEIVRNYVKRMIVDAYENTSDRAGQHDNGG